ncbi:hypothetical protein KW786_03360 [Candidatus Parcubacteria bacterium]|nr:hypothetical protein [Candidatus Parcubacteria bacterium]
MNGILLFQHNDECFHETFAQRSGVMSKRKWRVQVRVTSGTPATTPERFVNVVETGRKEAEQAAVVEMEKKHIGVRFRALSVVEQEND